jgi:hypothetical protein
MTSVSVFLFLAHCNRSVSTLIAHYYKRSFFTFSVIVLFKSMIEVVIHLEKPGVREVYSKTSSAVSIKE